MQSIEVDNSTFEEVTNLDDLSDVQKRAFLRNKKRSKMRTFKRRKNSMETDNLKFGKKLRKIGRGILAVSTGGISEVATKRGRKDLKKAAKDTGKAIKKIGGIAAFAPLLPLVPMMKKALKKKGKPVPSGVQNVAKAFYNEIVTKHGSYEEIHFDSDLDADNIISEAIGGIVKGILEFVKGLKKKKQAGDKLSDTEAVIADGTEIVEKKLNEQAQETAATEVGKKILFDRKSQIVIVLIIVAIVGVVLYLRRNK